MLTDGLPVDENTKVIWLRGHGARMNDGGTDVGNAGEAGEAARTSAKAGPTVERYSVHKSVSRPGFSLIGLLGPQTSATSS